LAVGRFGVLEKTTVYARFSQISVFAINHEDLSMAPFRVAHFRVENVGFRAEIPQWFSREYSP
jgi:hypothetical protein